MEQIDLMSWRRFQALLNNLSPYGAVAMHIREQQDKTEPRSDEAAASGFFQSMMRV